jgi:hypothetical protein
VNDKKVAAATIRAALSQLSQETVLLVDSFEQLRLRQQLRLVLRSRRAAGIIVTAHRPCILKTLHKTHTDTELLRSLVTQLDSSVEFHPTELKTLFSRHQGNLRTALRELYDRSSALAES